MCYFYLDNYNKKLYINDMEIHKLKKWLKNNKVSTKKFAKEIGVSVSYINFIIADKRRPSINVVNNIIHATNGELKLTDFLSKEDL